MALACGLELTTAAAHAQEIPLADVQAAAVAAVEAGDDAAAAALARRILTVHPGDALAEFVLTVVEMRAGRLAEARDHGRRAFRLADSKVQKFQAAMISADIADREGRRGALKFWLRQAADQAPNEAYRGSALKILQEERAKSPLSWRLSLSLSPSTNVNNGSSSPFSVIDGLFPIGVISAEGRALSGWEGSARVWLSYRLRETESARTEATAQLSVYRVALSDASRRKAPGLDAGDLADDVLKLGLRQTWMTADGRERRVLTLNLGRGFAGTGTTRDLIELSLGGTRMLAGEDVLSWGLELVHTDPEQARRSTTRRSTLTLGYSWALAGGDRLVADLTLADTAAGAGSDRVLREQHSATFRMSWLKKQPVGPFSLSLSAGIYRADYPEFALGFITVPGGRQDRSVFADLTLGLDEMSWAGFRPTITLRGLKTRSNVSIYSTDDLSMGLGIQAEF